MEKSKQIKTYKKKYGFKAHHDARDILMQIMGIMSDAQHEMTAFEDVDQAKESLNKAKKMLDDFRNIEFTTIGDWYTVEDVDELVDRLGKVDFELAGQNGNAYNLMAIFSREAKRSGWTEKEINIVLDEAKSNDYDHLLATLQKVQY